MPTTTLTSKGQMTLPKAIRDEMGLKTGDKVELVRIGNAAVIVPRNKPVETVFGLLSARAIAQTAIEDYDKAVREAVSDHLDDGEAASNSKDDAA
jgi:AbrB family looped-hinge helix DNA binding protein